MLLIITLTYYNTMHRANLMLKKRRYNTSDRINQTEIVPHLAKRMYLKTKTKKITLIF